MNPSPPRNYRRNRRHIAPLVCLCAWLASGCDWRKDPDPQPMQAPATQPSLVDYAQTPLDADGPESDVAALRLAIDVIRIELPLQEGAHQSGKLFNHVDESNADPALPALLARNGIRIGRAKRDDWPAMLAILEGARARSHRETRGLEPGHATLLRLGRVEAGKSYFVHTRDGGLAGATFEDGDKFVSVSYDIDSRDTQRVTLRVTLETRYDKAQRRLIAENGQIRAVNVNSGDVFSELAATLTLDADEFLILGGSEAAAKGLRLGSWWFRSDLGAEKLETLIFIKPQPVRWR